RGPPGELRVAIDDLGDARARDQVLVDAGRAVRLDAVAPAGCRGEIDDHPARDVREHAERGRACEMHGERDALIERVLVRLPAAERGIVRVGVPERPRAAALVETTGALAEAVDVVGLRRAHERAGGEWLR